MVFILSDVNSIANQFLFELRDKTIQTDSERFRTNLERLGSVMAYEISKSLNYQDKVVSTPLGTARVPMLSRQPVLVAVLRAGLPYYLGFQKFFNHAAAGFIGAMREEGGTGITIKLDYTATPEIDDREVILIDPMLATGYSLNDAVNALCRKGKPAMVHIASLVAAPEGIAFLKSRLKIPFKIWTVAVDERLNEKFYIVPGLGDAGDLSFGEKL